MTDKKPVPPSLAQFALEQLAESGEQAAIDLTVQNVEILRAEIERRDARIAELDEELALSNECLDMANENFAALKANKPIGLVLPERSVMQSLLDIGWNRAIDEVARLNPCRAQSVPDGWRMVKVGSEGVQFGNAWFSHEGITGYTAEQLNSGNCRVTGRAYMDWLAAAPSTQQKECGDE